MVGSLTKLDNFSFAQAGHEICFTGYSDPQRLQCDNCHSRICFFDEKVTTTKATTGFKRIAI